MTEYRGDYFAATEHEPVTLDAETIRELRKRAGMTQVELAAAVDVSEDTVAGWENNRARPGSAETAIRLVRVLEPEPQTSETTRLLPPRAVELSNDRALAVVNKRGQPPVVYFTKLYRVIEP